MKIRFWHLILLYLLPELILPATSAAQLAPYQRFGEEQGLPSNHIYCVFADSRGVIWAGTPAGVVRYRGDRFESLDQSDGLPQSEVLDILEDKYGNIWFQTFNCLARYRPNGSIVKVDLPYQDRKGHLPRQILWNGYNLIYSHLPIGDHHIFRKDHWEKVNWKNTELGKRYIWIQNGSSWAVNIESVKNADHPEISFPFINALFRRPLLLDSSTSVLLTRTHTYLFEGKEPRRINILTPSGQVLTQVITGLKDSHGNIWIADSGQGIFRYNASEFGDGVRAIEQNLDGMEITWIDEDLQGNLWFGTVREGLIMRPASSLNTKIIGAREGLPGRSVEDIVPDGSDGFLLAHENNTISHYRNQRIVRTNEVAQSCQICLIRDLQRFPDGSYIASTNEGLLHSDRPWDQWNVVMSSSMKSAMPLNDSVLLGTSYGLVSIHQDQIRQPGSYVRPKRIIVSKRCYALQLDEAHSVVWIGTNSGIYLYDLKRYSVDRPHFPALLRDLMVTSIRIDDGGRIWIATRGDGVFVVNGTELIQLSAPGSLSSNICHDLSFDPNGGVWIATQKGINYFESWSATAEGRVMKIDRREGLPSEEVHCLAVDRTDILAGTSGGLFILPVTFFKDYTSHVPDLRIDSILVEGQQKMLQETIDIPYRRNEVRINFTGILPQALGSLEYRYRLRGLRNDTWTLTQEQTAYFRSLAPGEYKFEVQARMSDRRWSTSRTLKITVVPGLWQIWWVWLVIALSGVAVVVVFAFLRIRSVRKRERRQAELRKQIIELKLQALRSQMNPHFIFNALAAIQQFIPVNEGLQAHKYLSVFARLIRRVLENSRSRYITLEEEIETLKLYLQIEDLRFSGKFSHSIRIPEHLDPREVLIPPMLVQPFVENAIQYGLRHKKGPGKLTISFFQDGDTLLCKVEDNGIGRVAAASMRLDRSNRPSQATKITEERLRSLGELIRPHAGIEIEDLADEQGIPSGTRILIRFPLTTQTINYATENHHR